MKRISVVIPTFNRLNQLKQVLTGLEKQTYPLEKFEVVVVSDGSSDGTNAFLEALETPLDLVPVFQANQGVATARNQGFKQANGELVLFIDDDVVPAPQLVAEHVQEHDAHQANIVVLGPMLSPPDFRLSPWTRWEQAMLVKQYDMMNAGAWEPTARQFYTGNSSLSRQLLLDSGGFDPAFRRAEDVELAYRLIEYDVRFIFNDRAVGYHYVSRSFASWMSTPYEYGRNDVIFSQEKGQTWLLPQVLQEYKGRHLFIRALTRACLDRHRLSQLSIMTLKSIAQLGDWMHLSGLSRQAYSGIFNLRYYQGMADELAGRKSFYQKMAQANQSKSIMTKKQQIAVNN